MGSRNHDLSIIDLPVPAHCRLSFRASMLSYSQTSAPATAPLLAANAATTASCVPQLGQAKPAPISAHVADRFQNSDLVRPGGPGPAPGGSMPHVVQCSGRVVMDIMSPALQTKTPVLRLVVLSVGCLSSSPCGRRSDSLSKEWNNPNDRKPFSLFTMDVPMHEELQRQMAKPPAGMHFFDCITASTHVLEAWTADAARQRITQNNSRGGGGSSVQRSASALAAAAASQLGMVRMMRMFAPPGGGVERFDRLEEKMVLDIAFQLPSDHGIDLHGSVAVLVDCLNVPPVVGGLGIPSVFLFEVIGVYLCRVLTNQGCLIQILDQRFLGDYRFWTMEMLNFRKV